MVVQLSCDLEVESSIPGEANFFLKLNFFAKIKPFIDAGLAKPKCFLFVITFLFDKIHFLNRFIKHACRL